MKIYVITTGCYSDYHIITATTDEELADKLADKFDAQVEEFEDAEIFARKCFALEFDKAGNVIDKVDISDDEYAYQKDFYYTGIDKNGVFKIVVTADNLDAAIKIGAEKRAMFLAEKAGI